ncbi:MAG: phosphosulfolactate synthase [Firmicutes bacterium]|nr:phosphosulfolactate synthase [Bacillota bacterium]
MQASKAWDGVCVHPIGGRSAKPRRAGVTMVIDKGLGLESTRELLSLAGDYIDFIKLGFGTSAFYDAELLRAKIRLIRGHGVHVYPGGTFLEVAELQSATEAFLDRAEALGFDFVEVSDGTLAIAPERRRRIIAAALERGLGVLTEVGKKHPADRQPLEVQRRQVREDLASGARYVIVEARESGVGVGIYDDDGRIDRAALEAFETAAPPERLIWEAPLKSQQEALIERFGPNVNLGNIHPQEVLALEALRVGLRGDTLRRAARVGARHE